MQKRMLFKVQTTSEYAICESKCESGTPRSGVSISRLASSMRQRRIERFANCF